MEKEVQKAILDYLHWRGIFCWKQPNGGTYRPAKIGKNGAMTKAGFIPAGMKGVPDIIAIIQGKFVGIEVKADSHQSEFQKEFQRRCEQAGGIYLLVHSIDEVEKELCRLFPKN